MSWAQPLIDLFWKAWDLITHMDVHLSELSASMGPWMYLLMFLVIFSETGLIIMPFLPGDSLLFALGALSALPESGLNVYVMGVLLFIAAVIGDALNFSIGNYMGPKVFRYEDSWWLNKKHLLRTRAFFERHGGKAIVLARFLPIVRTFAPFVAGIGDMTYRRFAFFNVVGGFVWVASFLALGYGFGNLPVIKTNFHYVIFGIIFVSVLPVVFELVGAWRAGRVKSASTPGSPVP